MRSLLVKSRLSECASHVHRATGTIALLMDCDTTGIEPDFALVKFKKLAGGGYFKIVNQSVEPALRRLGYNNEQIAAIEVFAKGTNTLEVRRTSTRRRSKRRASTTRLSRKSNRNCSARSRSASCSTSTFWAWSFAARSSA